MAAASVFLALRKLLMSSRPWTPATGGENGTTPIVFSAAGPASLMYSSSAHQLRHMIWAVDLASARFLASLAAPDDTFWMMTYLAPWVLAWPIWAR